MTIDQKEELYLKTRQMTPTKTGDHHKGHYEEFHVNDKRVVVWYAKDAHSEWPFDWDMIDTFPLPKSGEQIEEKVQNALVEAGIMVDSKAKVEHQTGVQYIQAERARQFDLGYDHEHDLTENKGELAVAAGLYALDTTYAQEILESSTTESGLAELWPWQDGSYPDKRGVLDRIRQLTIAGALIAAEIDRLLADASRKSS